jgi:photosystem II stability/assembly factor-like uncharacterized protein
MSIGCDKGSEKMYSRREFGAGLIAAGTALALAAPARAIEPVWQKLPIEPYKGKQDDICFIDTNTGWYGNGAGKLYRTTNGGNTWTRVADRPGTFIRALGFIDSQTGFIGNVGTDYYPGVTDKQPLYRTNDGGITWVQVKAEGIEKVAGICAIDILPVRRMFQGDIRLSHIIHAAGRVGGPAMIMQSHDDGATWRVIDLSKQAGMILDVKFLDPHLGFVCASGVDPDGNGSALILRTTDGGTTWQPAYNSGRKMENCWKMSWPSKRVGYATVQSYDDRAENTNRVVVKTTDGGRTWQELPLANIAGEQEFGVGFLNEQRGWIGCKAGGYETRDGGNSWAPLAFGRAVNKIRVIKSGTGARVFAIGVDMARLDL